MLNASEIKQAHVFEFFPQGVVKAVWSPSGDRIAVLLTGGGAIHVFSKSGEELTKINLNTDVGKPWAFEFLDADHLIMQKPSGFDGNSATLSIYNLSNRRFVSNPVEIVLPEILFVSKIVPDLSRNSIIVSGINADQTLRGEMLAKYSYPDGKLIEKVQVESSIHGMKLINSGRILSTCGGDVLTKLDAIDLSRESTFKFGASGVNFEADHCSFAASPDGRYALVGAKTIMIGNAAHSVESEAAQQPKLFDLYSGRPVHDYRNTPTIYYNMDWSYVQAVDWSQDGRYALICDNSNDLTIIEVADLKTARRLGKVADLTESISISPDGHSFLAATPSSVVIYDISPH